MWPFRVGVATMSHSCYTYHFGSKIYPKSTTKVTVLTLGHPLITSAPVLFALRPYIAHAKPMSFDMSLASPSALPSSPGLTVTTIG
jgi:hypothetical protein